MVRATARDAPRVFQVKHLRPAEPAPQGCAQVTAPPAWLVVLNDLRIAVLCSTQAALQKVLFVAVNLVQSETMIDAQLLREPALFITYVDRIAITFVVAEFTVIALVCVRKWSVNEALVGSHFQNCLKKNASESFYNLKVCGRQRLFQKINWPMGLRCAVLM